MTPTAPALRAATDILSVFPGTATKDINDLASHIDDTTGLPAILSALEGLLTSAASSRHGNKCSRESILAAQTVLAAVRKGER